VTTGIVPGRVPDPAQEIDKLVEEYQRHTGAPGVCVSVHYPKHFGEAGLVKPYGLARVECGVEVAADTIFGIGSVTKVFTSLLLACAVKMKYSRVKLTDRAIDYLSQYGATGSATFDDVTLLQLATHTSGMPKQAPAGPTGNQLFTDEPPSAKLLDYWKTYLDPLGPPCWQYSNTAFVTLGFAVTAMFPGLQGNQYNELLSQYVTGPLGMANTKANPAEEHFATGYNRYGENVEEKPATTVVSDLKSTGADMLILLKAYLGPQKVDNLLSDAIALTAEQNGDYDICGAPGKTMRMGLAWQISSAGEYWLHTKDGSTDEGGFNCMVEFSREANFGIAVLTNQVWHKAPKDGVNNPQELTKQLRQKLVPELSEPGG
jgi:beta-lactamase class C